MGYLRAISTLGCPDLGLADLATLLRAHGLDGVELRVLGGELDLPAWFAAQCGDPHALLVQVRRLQLNIVALNTSFKLVRPTEADRAALLAFVPWAEALGVRWLRVFDGQARDEADFLAAAIETLGWWHGRRRAHGWACDLMVETHDSLFSGERIARFAQAAGGAAILWDTHHTWRKGGEDPLKTWHRIRPHVVHMHVKDSINRPGPKHPFTYVLPGDGEFPAGPLLDVLRREYEGYVSLEWERKWHPELPPVEDALRAAERRSWW